MALQQTVTHRVRGISLLASAILLVACGKQSEGQRCDLRNGSADCESGLVCTPGDELNGIEGKGAALCCPPEGEPPTTEGCQRSGMVIPTLDGGGISIPDAGGSAADGGA
jgi:hypothetical protein